MNESVTRINYNILPPLPKRIESSFMDIKQVNIYPSIQNENIPPKVNRPRSEVKAKREFKEPP